MNSFESFLKLHQDSAPLLLGNAWDVVSAKILEQSGIKAIGTSSWAVAQAMGFEDGEKIPFDHLLNVARRIREAVKIPVSVDLEAGYGRTIDAIVSNIERLCDVGVVGINLEDSVNRKLLAAGEFQRTLEGITDQLIRKNIRIFINVRTDAFILKHPSPLEETLKRIEVYKRFTISGIFVPYAIDRNDLAVIVNSTKLPVNVLCNKDLPAFDDLQRIGIKRISMGTSLFNAANVAMRRLLDQMNSEGNCQMLFR